MSPKGCFCRAAPTSRLHAPSQPHFFFLATGAAGRVQAMLRGPAACPLVARSRCSSLPSSPRSPGDLPASAAASQPPPLGFPGAHWPVPPVRRPQQALHGSRSGSRALLPSFTQRLVSHNAEPSGLAHCPSCSEIPPPLPSSGSGQTPGLPAPRGWRARGQAGLPRAQGAHTEPRGARGPLGFPLLAACPRPQVTSLPVSQRELAGRPYWP